ncbi:hypothetical protein H6F89_32120 [Cyanobacteria bacterium FACHB-63]|nr:hypothetical protein [Cyanobacteria bacterium FACHB-63]
MAKSSRKSIEPGKKPAARPQIPEKCRKCAMLTMPQVHALHGAEGTGERCYDPSVCRSRRSHARKSEQNNYNRRIQHKQKKRQSQQSDFAAALFGDAVTSAPPTSTLTQSIHPPLSVPLPKAISQRYYAILLLYREPRYRGRVHAIRAQVWQGSDLVNEIKGEHCIGMTPGDVIHYVEAMLALLKEVYDIPYFADIEQLDPDYCPIRPCPRHSARFVQIQV